MKYNIIATSVIMALSPAWASAEIKLPSFFTDNMIVQQNSELTVPVHTEPGAKVSVDGSWGAKASVKAGADGVARVKLATPEAGGPYALTVSNGKDSVKLQNVLSGEVWLCSGQSNMEFPVNGWTHIMNHDDVIGNAHRPDIRLLQVRDITAFKPLDDTEVNMGGWVECNSATMQDFSAIAYLFATRLHNELRVPVGVIDCCWGGTPAEAWTSAEALGAVPGFGEELKMLAEANGNAGIMSQKWGELYQARMAKAEKKLPSLDKAKVQSSWSKMPVPSFWEDNIAPGLDGIVYLQTTFNLTADEASKGVELHLGAIDDEDITWVNGHEVARGSGFATPRNYSVKPEYLKAGENVLTIQVTDNGGEGGIRANANDLTVSAHGRNLSIAGDWSYLIGCDFRTIDPLPASVNGSSFPSVLYNAMLHPLHVMPVKGVLWYQGCANVGRGEQYEPLFKALINNWRKLWGEELPFYFVQLAGWLKPQSLQPDSEWALLRNSQSKALELPNTAMVTAIDLGNPADIHPRNKQEVARRLAELALTRNYGRNYDWQAPVCTAANRKGSKMVLTFDRPVDPRSVAVTGFIVGDGKGNFAVARGTQTAENTIELSAAEISRPEVARYNWADYPGGNLYGTNGLPVAPFATDK